MLAQSPILARFDGDLGSIPMAASGMQSNKVPTRAPARAAGKGRTFSRAARVKTAAIMVSGGVLVAGVAASLRGLLHALDYNRVVDAFHATSGQSLVFAGLATGASYAALIGYDFSGLSYVGARIPKRVAMLSSFCAFALGNTIGFGPLTGGAVRYRFYAAVGLKPGQIARVILFCAVSFGLGVLGVAGLSLLLRAVTLARLVNLPPVALVAFGSFGVATIITFLCLCAFRARPLKILGREVELPGLRLAIVQLLLAFFDITISAAALWVLLPPLPIGFLDFAAIYAGAIGLAVASHMPGGLGVFEGAIMLSVGRHGALDAIAAALLLYRMIYFLGPLVLATLLLGGAELQRNARFQLFGSDRPIGHAIEGLMPAVLSAFCFLAGIMLLASGVTPARQDVLELLALQVPLPILEASHFLASIAGLVLLFVARGLFHRLDAAWWVAFMIAAANLGLVMIKGGDFDEYLVLGLFLAVLGTSRRLFRRPASLLAQAFTVDWLLAAGAVAAAIGWLFFFSYEAVPYHRELWWQFEFDAQAPRALRAGLAVLLLLFVAALRFMFRAAPAPSRLPKVEELDVAQEILRQQERPEANLALLGDKSLLFSRERDAFIMYGRRGRSWIALFDPVGPRSAWTELVWRFAEMAAASEGRVAFYHVRPECLTLYLDYGLRVIKLGEEALLPLDRFSLKGPRLANLRNSVSRGERDGLSVEIVGTERLPALIPELARISEAWLRSNRAHEKAFSLGAFQPGYVARQTVAVVRQANRLVAFATLMLTERRTEVMVDLMRLLPEAPRATMDYLFVRLIEHFKREGYGSFSLGMAPLAGLAAHPLASGWHRVGHLLYRHGEHFYNFQGLRAFKDKFDPVWQPRYFAGPSGLGTYLALADVAALIGAGIRPGTRRTIPSTPRLCAN